MNDTTRPSFSIVIPAYNYGHCVTRAVTSALRQDYPNFDVTVIDDGSSDNTQDVLQRLLVQGDTRLRCIKQSNAGLSAVRNRGIRNTSNDWLIFLDADDELLPGALQQFATTIEQHPSAAFVIGNHDTDNGKTRRSSRPPIVSHDAETNFRNYLEKRLNISNGACAMHRQLFAQQRYREDLRNNEDIPVFARILATFTVATTPQSITLIHKHADSWRHNLPSVLEVGLHKLEAAIFDADLPAWTAPYRKPFRARRALFLVREAAKSGHAETVRHFYLLALRCAPLQALHPRYLRRFLASFFLKQTDTET
jgi:glycosyltransferase involved in cell wall biosynthesis